MLTIARGVRTLRLQEAIDIAAPPEVVWEAFRGLDSWPEWNAVCLSSRWTSGEPWEIGSSFFMRLRMAGVPVPFHVKIVEFGPAKSVAWDSTVLTVTGHRRFLFEALSGGGTHVSDTKTFGSPLLPLRLFYPRPIIQRMSRDWLRSLKAHAEAQS